MRLYFGLAVSSKYQATTANELKHSIFNMVVFWLSTFVNIYYCFFNKPVYSCKDTTLGFSKDDFSADQGSTDITRSSFSVSNFPMSLSNSTSVTSTLPRNRSLMLSTSRPHSDRRATKHAPYIHVSCVLLVRCTAYTKILLFDLFSLHLDQQRPRFN